MSTRRRALQRYWRTIVITTLPLLLVSIFMPLFSAWWPMKESAQTKQHGIEERIRAIDRQANQRINLSSGLFIVAFVTCIGGLLFAVTRLSREGQNQIDGTSPSIHPG
jgi:H+/Cl- antiporter ClcA